MMRPDTAGRPLEFAEADDSLDELAAALSRQWRPVVLPIAAAIARHVAASPDLATAHDTLAGRLPRLPDGPFRQRVREGMLQSRLVGRAGLPVRDGELAFAEGDRVPLKPLPDAEAVRYLTSKQVGGRFSFDWRDVRDEEHVTSFVVAKAMKASLLGDMHTALGRALQDGWSRQRFIDELTPTLQKAGWWGEKEMTDPETGERRLVQLGSPRRLKTIFDVNIRMAHAAGRWERIKRVAKPGDLLRYVAVMDERTRAEHQAWHNTTLPVDHPFWRTHYPPCGWNCRCTAVLVTSHDARRRGLTATSDDQLAERGYGRELDWLNTRTGEVERTPAGIDPGFGYNVGEARLQAFEPRLRGRDEGVPPQLQSRRPAPPPPRPFDGELLDGMADVEAQVAALLAPFRELLGDSNSQAVFTDAAQVPLVVSRALIETADGRPKGAKRGRARYLPVIARTIADPDEIWAELHEVKDAAGQVTAVVWRRRYVGWWRLPGERQEAMMAAFDEDGDTWTGVTAFAPGSPRSIGQQQNALDNRVRIGVLLWRRR